MKNNTIKWDKNSNTAELFSLMCLMDKSVPPSVPSHKAEKLTNHALTLVQKGKLVAYLNSDLELLVEELD